MKYKKELLAILIMTAFVAVVIPTVAVIATDVQAKASSNPFDPNYELDAYYYTFVNPTAGKTVSGTVSIQITARYDSATLYAVRVYLYKSGTLLAGPVSMTKGTNYAWTASWNTANYADGTGYELRYRLYRTSTSYTTVSCGSLTVNNGGGGGTPPPSTGEKIGVFFYATDAGTSTVISKYQTYLQREGFTKFFVYRDCTNVASACTEIDNYEDSNDIIFVYIIGHGNNNGQHSYTCFRPSASVVYSNTFRTYMNAWEATQKCLLVESCHSGDWADDFRASPYLAMSTSDETHVSYAYSTLPGEGKFSYYFFLRVYNGYSAVDAFNYAKSYCTNQYPKIANYASYNWFA